MPTELRDSLLIGCGNPLLDISATVDEAFVRKYDMKPNDAILAEPKHLPVYKELVERYQAEFIAGGSVQNTLRIAQWILDRPNVCTFFGCVGMDDYATTLQEKATQAGVDVRYQHTSAEPTGTCAVLITGTNRSLCANLAAANKFDVAHIHVPVNRQLIEQARYFYISGFFLTVSPPTIMEIARYAHEHQRTFLMNLSAPFVAEFFSEPQLAALPYVDVLFGNETEAAAFAKVQGWPTDDLKAIGLRIAAMPKANASRPRVVILTQGPDDVLLIQADSDAVRGFAVEKLPLEQIVDTNGAGDAFVGGFLAQFVQEQPLDVCIRCGIWAARHVIQRSGCTTKGAANFQANPKCL